MKIKLLSHASVIIKTSDCKILTDPWYESSAFMNSWSLHPKPNLNLKDLEEITHLFISHEHPDHFNFPTLKSLPAEFKKKVTILVQKNNSNRMPKVLKSALDFDKIILCENNKKYDLTNETSIQINQFGLGPDSSLAIFNKDKVILNINDCELNSKDCKILLKSLKKVDYVLNQFSIAGYRGNWNFDKSLKLNSKQILDNMINNHKDLKCKVTIPFASFIYFSDNDNKYLNKYTNKIDQVYQRFKDENLNIKILYLEDETEIDKSYNSIDALEKFKSADKMIDNLPYRDIPKKDFGDLKKYFKFLLKNLESRYPTWLIKLCGDLTVYLEDLDIKVLISFRKNKFDIIETEDFDIKLNSEALEYALKFTWGFSTISVGGKFLIKSKYKVWSFYKLITSLNNAGIYLKLKYLFSKNNFLFIKSRYNGIFNQLIYKIQRNFNN